MELEVGQEYTYERPNAFPPFTQGMAITVTEVFPGGGCRYTSVYLNGGTGEGTIGSEYAKRFLKPVQTTNN